MKIFILLSVNDFSIITREERNEGEFRKLLLARGVQFARVFPFDQEGIRVGTKTGA